MPRVLVQPIPVPCGRCGAVVILLHALPLPAEPLPPTGWVTRADGTLGARSELIACEQCGDPVSGEQVVVLIEQALAEAAPRPEGA